jgi:hypothetical protein
MLDVWGEQKIAEVSRETWTSEGSLKDSLIGAFLLFSSSATSQPISETQGKEEKTCG